MTLYCLSIYLSSSPGAQVLPCPSGAGATPLVIAADAGLLASLCLPQGLPVYLPLWAASLLFLLAHAFLITLLMRVAVSQQAAAGSPSWLQLSVQQLRQQTATTRAKIE